MPGFKPGLHTVRPADCPGSSPSHSALDIHRVRYLLFCPCWESIVSHLKPIPDTLPGEGSEGSGLERLPPSAWLDGGLSGRQGATQKSGMWGKGPTGPGPQLSQQRMLAPRCLSSQPQGPCGLDTGRGPWAGTHHSLPTPHPVCPVFSPLPICAPVHPLLPPWNSETWGSCGSRLPPLGSHPGVAGQ